jgi:hypothetical protein
VFGSGGLVCFVVVQYFNWKIVWRKADGFSSINDPFGGGGRCDGLGDAIITKK